MLDRLTACVEFFISNKSAEPMLQFLLEMHHATLESSCCYVEGCDSSRCCNLPALTIWSEKWPDAAGYLRQ